MTLRETFLVCPQDHRHMGKLWDFIAKSFIHGNLAHRVIDMIITTNNQVDAHLGIIDHHNKVIGRVAIGALDNQIIKLIVFNRYRALDTVDKSSIAITRRFETDNKGGLRLISTLATSPVVTRLATSLHCGFTFGVQFVGAAVTTISETLVEQVSDFTLVEIVTFRLVKRALIVTEAQPVHSLQDSIDRFLGRSLHISVLDPQHEDALLFLSQQVIKQGRPGATNVQVTGWTRGKTNSQIRHQRLLRL